MIVNTQAPAQPASSCFRCPTRQQGIVSNDQTTTGPHGNATAQLAKSVRFHCPKCAHVWVTDAEDAELQGRFLDKARLR